MLAEISIDTIIDIAVLTFLVAAAAFTALCIYRLGQYSDAVMNENLASYEDGWQKGYERAVQEANEDVMYQAWLKEQEEIEREIQRDLEDYGNGAY